VKKIPTVAAAVTKVVKAVVMEVAAPITVQTHAATHVETTATHRLHHPGSENHQFIVGGEDGNMAPGVRLVVKLKEETLVLSPYTHEMVDKVVLDHHL